MQTTNLRYRDKQYLVYIMSSTSREPHFHWILFNDDDLLNSTGGEDSICFQVINGNLVCTSLIAEIRCPDLVEIARQIITDYLEKKN